MPKDKAQMMRDLRAKRKKKDLVPVLVHIPEQNVLRLEKYVVRTLKGECVTRRKGN